MPTKRVPVYELEIGMYVARIDLSWLRSPFLRRSFLIERLSQIEKLIRAGVKAVEIDPARGRPVPDTKGATGLLARPTRVSSAAIMPPARGIKSLAELNEEYAQARIAKEQLSRAVRSAFSAFLNNGTIQAGHAAEAVQEITIVTRTLSSAAIFMALSQHRAGDATFSQHALTTCTLSLVMGQRCGLNPLELQQLGTAALLHDIGLSQVPSHIVQRAHTTSPPLSPSDQRQLQTHPRLSILMLERQGRFDTAILHLIEEHHVYLDGSGYPPETRGEFTSERTRILMIMDHYDELITGFGGASPLVPHQALQRLYQEAREGKFDVSVLARFIQVVGIYPVHSYVQLNTKEIAVVTDLNPDALHRPVVTVTHDPNGVGYQPPIVIDLARQEDQPGERTIDTVIETLPQPAPVYRERSVA